MRIIFFIIVLFIISCDNNHYDNDFYLVVNDILVKDFPDAKVVIAEPLDFYNSSDNSGLFENLKTTNLYPEQPPNTVDYSKLFFISLILGHLIDSLNANEIFEYKLTNRNKKFENFDYREFKTKVISKTEFSKFSNDSIGSFWNRFFKRYNVRSYISISPPLYNKRRSLMILTINYHCGDLCGQGVIYALKKNKIKEWEVIYKYVDWVS